MKITSLLIKRGVFTLLYFLIYLKSFSQGPNQSYNLTYYSRDISVIIDLLSMNDSIISLEQTIFNNNDSLSLFFQPAIILDQPGFSIFARSDDIFIYSSTRNVNPNSFDMYFDIYQLPPKESVTYCNKFKLKRQKDITGMVFWIDYAFECKGLRSKISFKEFETFICGGTSKALLKYSIHSTEYGKYCTGSSITQRNICIFHK